MSRYQYSEQLNFGSPRITWAVQRLMLLNIGVFALQVLIDPLQYIPFLTPILHGAGGMIPGGRLNDWFGFQPDNFLRGMIWKPFTYQFLHAGLMHLFMNMLWLFFFGPDVERTLGTRQFYKFYIFCGAAGVLATFVPFVMGRGTSVTGASGAAMGVMVAFAIVDPERQFFLFPLPIPINARALVIIVLVMQIAMALSGGGNVSVETHFGGMACGYLYMKFMPKFRAWQRERRRNGSKSKPVEDKIGEAVDNIFKFEDKKRR